MDGSASDRGPSIRRAAPAGLRWTAPRGLLLRPLLRPLLRLLLRLLRWPANVHRARQLLRVLSGLTDHELRDIGLCRRDLQALRGLPLDADPSAALARWAGERRSRSRTPRSVP